MNPKAVVIRAAKQAQNSRLRFASESAGAAGAGAAGESVVMRAVRGPCGRAAGHDPGGRIETGQYGTADGSRSGGPPTTMSGGIPRRGPRSVHPSAVGPSESAGAGEGPRRSTISPVACTART